MSAGVMGLVIAADKYDIDNARGASFSTYATYWIRQRVSVENIKVQNIVHIPEGQRGSVIFMYRSFDKMSWSKKQRVLG